MKCHVNHASKCQVPAPGPANIKQQIKPRPLGQASPILIEIADLSPLSPDLQSSKKKINSCSMGKSF